MGILYGRYKKHNYLHIHLVYTNIQPTHKIFWVGFIHNEWLNEWYEHSEQRMNLEYYAETQSLGLARLYRKDSLIKTKRVIGILTSMPGLVIL